MGFHTPSQGRVMVDDIPLIEMDINSYRRRIGYVPQDSILFNMTIRENLLWSMPDAGDDDIKEACHSVNAHEFIEYLPLGL